MSATGAPGTVKPSGLIISDSAPWNGSIANQAWLRARRRDLIELRHIEWNRTAPADNLCRAFRRINPDD
jgi:hypothetical protein